MGLKEARLKAANDWTRKPHIVSQEAWLWLSGGAEASATIYCVDPDAPRGPSTARKAIIRFQKDSAKIEHITIDGKDFVMQIPGDPMPEMPTFTRSKETIAAFREYCNKTYGFVPAKDSGNRCKEKTGARKRLYGDYLYHQDRDMFMASLEDEIKAGTFKMETTMTITRIAWIDSAGQPSHIHLTADGKTTLCDAGGADHSHYIAHRTLAKSPRKTAGRSNYCSHCCKLAGKKAKSLPWDSRCKDVEWVGPATAPYTRVPHLDDSR